MFLTCFEVKYIIIIIIIIKKVTWVTTAVYRVNDVCPIVKNWWRCNLKNETEQQFLICMLGLRAEIKEKNTWIIS